MDIIFVGNSACVSRVVVHSVVSSHIGTEVELAFTDSSGTGESDMMDGTPIAAGNFTVTD